MFKITDLKIRSKLSMIVAALVVPVILFGALFVNQALKDVAFAKKEIKGLEFLDGTWTTTMAIMGAAEEGVAPSTKIGSRSDLKAVANKYAKSLGLNEAYSQTLQKLDAVGYPDNAMAENENADKAIEATRDMMIKIADASNLTLDPEVDSYYVMNMIVTTLSEANHRSDTIYSAASHDVKDGLNNNAALAQLSTQIALYEAARSSTRYSYEAAIKANASGELNAQIGTAYTAFDKAATAFVAEAQRVSTQLQNAEPVSLDRLLALHEATDTATDGLWRISGTSLRALLEQRINTLNTGLMTMLALGLMATLIAISLSYMIAMDVSGSIARLSASMTRLSQDDYEVEIAGVGRKDEIGAMARCVEVFKQNGLSAIASFRDNLRVKTALDNASTNVMVSDVNGKIIYANQAVQSMMKTAESDIRNALPNFEAAKIVGSSMDIFHKNPAHQKSMLERLTQTYRTAISVGGRHFNLIASPVLDPQGLRLGSVVEWADVTQERRIEGEVDHVVNEAVAGNFRARLSETDKTGFMLNLTQSINRLCATTAETLDEVNGQLTYLAKGDLTRRIEKTYGGMFEELRCNLNETSDQLAMIVEQVVTSAGEIKVATSEITSGTNDLSQRTEAQASSLQETAASMEEIAATVRLNAQNAIQASELAANADMIAVSSSDVVSNAVDAMARIENSSQKISDIIGVIDEIAFQTNLLALNAAVEAARAGDAGKGFAVVAAEVRSLAQRSSGAAKDIKGLIATSGSEVKDGVKLVNDAGEALTQIAGSIKQVSAIISEIASASREQATGIEEINRAVSQMDEMTQQNSALVEENAASSRLLQDQAESLNTQMSAFTLSNGQNITQMTRRPPQARSVSAYPAMPRQKARGAASVQADLRQAIENDADWQEF